MRKATRSTAAPFKEEEEGSKQITLCHFQLHSVLIQLASEEISSVQWAITVKMHLDQRECHVGENVIY